MSTNQLRVAGTGLFFLLIFLSGFWLSRSDKPYNAILFNVHKLIALAALVFIAATIYQVNQVSPLSATALGASVVTALFFLSTFVSGGLLSTDQSMPAAVSTVHLIAPFLTVLSTAATLYLLLNRP